MDLDQRAVALEILVPLGVWWDETEMGRKRNSHLRGALDVLEHDGKVVVEEDFGTGVVGHVLSVAVAEDGRLACGEAGCTWLAWGGLRNWALRDRRNLCASAFCTRARAAKTVKNTTIRVITGTFMIALPVL